MIELFESLDVVYFQNILPLSKYRNLNPKVSMSTFQYFQNTRIINNIKRQLLVHFFPVEDSID